MFYPLPGSRILVGDIIRIEKLKPRDGKEYSLLVRRVIRGSSHYTPAAKDVMVKDFSARKIMSRLSDSSHMYMVAKDGNKLVGFLVGSGSEGVFWLQWIGVDQERRNTGVANLLLHDLTHRLKSRKTHKIALAIRPENTESLSFFRKQGFKQQTYLKRHWNCLDYFMYYKFI